MGSAFAGEPLAWFEGINEPIVTVGLLNPDMCVHREQRDCQVNEPHLWHNCGIVIAAAAEANG